MISRCRATSVSTHNARFYSPETTQKAAIVAAGDAAVYQEIIDTYFMPNILFSDMSLDRVEFQQDNAPSHTAKTTKENLKNISLRVLQFPRTAQT